MKRNMVRKGVLSTALLFILGMSVPAVQAAPSIDLDSVTGNIGDIVTVSITLINERWTEIVGTTNYIEFNPDYLSFIGCTIGPAGEAANKDPQCNETSPGLIKAGVFGINLDPIPDGVIAYLNFEVLACGDHVLVNVPDAANPSGDPVEVSGEDGEISIPCGALLDLGSDSGAEGETVTIPITLTNIPGTEIAGTANDIGFNPSYFSVVDCTVGPAGVAANKDVEYSQPSPGVLRVGVLT